MVETQQSPQEQHKQVIHFTESFTAPLLFQLVQTQLSQTIYRKRFYSSIWIKNICHALVS